MSCFPYIKHTWRSLFHNHLLYFSIVLCRIQTLTWVSSDRGTFITAGMQTVLCYPMFLSVKEKRDSYMGLITQAACFGDTVLLIPDVTMCLQRKIYKRRERWWCFIVCHKHVRGPFYNWKSEIIRLTILTHFTKRNVCEV